LKSKYLQGFRGTVFKRYPFFHVCSRKNIPELSAKLGEGDHTVSIAVIKPVYVNGKYLNL